MADPPNAPRIAMRPSAAARKLRSDREAPAPHDPDRLARTGLNAPPPRVDDKEDKK